MNLIKLRYIAGTLADTHDACNIDSIYKLIRMGCNAAIYIHHHKYVKYGIDIMI